MNIESDIKQKALELGFDAVGITTAEPVEQEQIDHYHRWLETGCAAKMAYLHRNLDKRFTPANLLNGAQSVICVALNYRPAKMELAENPTIRIAHFAQYEDYHPFIKDQLFQLAEFIQEQIKARRDNSPENSADEQSVRFKACVDSAPLAERALAQRAGLGFIGKNHMLIHPELGNQILLGELVTTLQLQPDEPMTDIPCGDCGKCIRACPTGALGSDGSFDSRKCISYLTIEAPDEIDGQYHDKINGYVFGCDECILACPHEMNAPPRKNTDFQFHPEWQKLTPGQIQNITEADFKEIFAGSGFLRSGLKKLKQITQIRLKTNPK